MIELLQFDFMRRALIAALLVGLVAPAIGTFIVQRRLALLGDGIGHVALTGVALGFLTGTAPVLTAVVVAVLGAVAIELVRARGRTSGDVALALLFYGGIAGGVLLIWLAPGGSNATLMSYLFGSISSVTTAGRVGHRRAGGGRARRGRRSSAASSSCSARTRRSPRPAACRCAS